MENREKTVSRVTVWGAVVNLVLTALKFIAGVAGRSSAMVADAVHSMSDLVSDLVVLVMVRVSSKEEDKSHDYGHGKFETLATVIVAVLLLAVALKLMVGGIGKMRDAVTGKSVGSPGTVALLAAVVSIVSKEILYRWTVRVGRRVNSQVMIANAWHHRTDALSSIGSAAGIGGAMLLGGRWVILDPLVCCVISVCIFVVGVKMAVPALAELTEASLPDEMEERILSIVRGIDGVDNVHALKTRRSGPNILIEAHIVVDPEMSVADAHRITEASETALRKEYGAGTHISLHVEPSIESD